MSTENGLIVFIDGVYQADNVYSVSGTTLTFATAPLNSRIIEVFQFKVSSIVGVAPVLATMTGDGSDTTLALSTTPSSENQTFVTIDGVVQHKDTYAVSGSTLTFSAAPPTGTKVECITFTNVAVTTFQDADGDTKVQVEESSDEDKIRFDTGGTERVIIDSTGVGIGTSSPSVPLDIVTNLSSDTTTSPDTVLTIATKYASTGSNGGAGAGPRLEFKIPDDETNPITGAAIAGIKEAADDSDASAGMAFYISQNDTTLDEAVRIDHDGKVGIGTNAPAGPLHVAGHTSSLASTFEANANGDTVPVKLKVKANNGTTSLEGLEGEAGSASSDNSLTILGTDNIKFKTGATERMRISSAGTILIGKTAEDTATDGIELNRNDVLVATRDGDSPLLLNRRTSDGTIAEFRRDNNVSGTLNSVVANRISLRAGSTAGYLGVGSTDYFAWNTTDFRPAADDSYDLGASGARFDDIYATNGTIQTSDQNEKNTITNSDLGLDFINRLSPKSYKFNSKTRTHYGLIAQDVETVLSDISKSTTDFAGFIKDDISEEQDGSSYRYGLRYNEFISPLIKAIQEQQTIIDNLTTRIETLEGGE